MAGVLLVLAVFAAATVASRATRGTSIGDLRRGSCFNLSKGVFGEKAERVSCSARHTDEVAGVVTFPAPRGAAYPGRDGILELGTRDCPPLVSEFYGQKPPDPTAETFVFGPDQAAWERGERAVVCSLRAPSAAKRTGSYLDG